jgi:cytochrome c biogenesis protein CcmG/thiol:disulfide interchange protein DsbE
MTEHPIENTPEEETKPSGPRWGRILAWGGLFVLLLITGLGLIRAQEGSVSAGQPAPEFELTTYDGEIYSSENLKGKIIVLNFWASFCIPCGEEADELETAWQYYKDQGDVVFLGVAWSDMDSKAKAYLDFYGITYPNGPDMRTRISQAFRMVAVPETYIIDRDGIITHAQIGQFTSVEQIISLVDAALE